MGLITEASLRLELKNKKTDKYYISPGTKITPSAREYLKERNIEAVFKEEGRQNITSCTFEAPKAEVPCAPKYTLHGTGGYIDKKPEYMTHLHGNNLVLKNHPRIVLRGKIDSLESKILELMVTASKSKIESLIKDLREILDFVREILRSEVLEEELREIKLLSLSDEELRERSHNPRKYFGMNHVLPDYSMGEIAIGLNSLRSSVREVEICAVTAFSTGEGVSREDILKALNRLSSCFYIMMLKFLSGGYK